MDAYYSRNEVSHSDLSWLENQLRPRMLPDPTKAYLFGNLFDAMLTENEKVNYFKRSWNNEVFSVEDFTTSEKMKRGFYNDDFCKMMATGADGQKVMSKHLQLNYNGFDFDIKARCKWDLWQNSWNWGGDIKSTFAETQKQFEGACKTFNYYRSRAWYMDIAGSERDVIIGVSKKNYKIFKVYLNKDSENYKNGKNQYLELAFKWFLLYGNCKPIKTYEIK